MTERSVVPAGQELLRLIADSSGFWEYLDDPRGNLVWMSPACEAVTGRAPEEFLGNPGLLQEIVHPEDRILFASHRSACRVSDGSAAAYFRIVRRDGAVRWIGHRCRPVSFPGEETFGRRTSNQDITDLKKSEEELLRLNRTLRARSNTNQAMLRATDEPGFLAEVCRIVVEDCGHTMVWVGFAGKDDARSVRPVAQAGADQGYIDSLAITWADTERGRGPTGTAIRTGKPAECKNMMADPAFAPWRDAALQRGYASSIALPLLSEGQAFGAISIYSREAGHFSDEEVKLLSELASDLAFGIKSLRSRAVQAETERALRESEERFRSLFESMGEGFVVGEMVCDAEGTPTDWLYLNVNPAFTQLTGLSREQVVGKKVLEVLPGFDPFWIEAIGEVLKTGAGKRLEGHVTRLKRHFEAFAWRLGVGRFAVVFNDVTERRKAEEQLRLQHAALQAAGNGIVITGRDGTIQWVNPAFTRLTGYSAAEAIGKNPRVLKSGKHDSAFYRGIWETILAGRIWHDEIVNRRKDGSLYTEEMTIAPVADAGGSITHFVAVKQDVTARKETEKRLRELNETLEQRVLERTTEAQARAVQLWALTSKLTQAELKERQQLAGVLHDHLQQVLVAAKFNLDALKGKVAGDDLVSLTRRIDELLDESIAECRSLTIGLSPPVLRESGLAAALGWLARHLQEQHGLRVDLAVADDWVEPPDADLKTFLFDAVRELLFNVAKHSGVLEARLTMGLADGDLRIVLEDQGTGFDLKALSARRWDEVGFGLFSIRQRMELFGGAMDVESAPGRGTRVTLRARPKAGPEEAATAAEPLPDPVPGEKPRPRRIPSRSGRIRVVIADDHRILRQGLVALLRAEPDIEVVGEAADGIEAVELARALRPDVVIMDVSMPRMNGIEATRRIVAELPGVRIICLSMHEDEAIAASMREAGAVGFVTKGGRSDALTSAIHAALRGGTGNEAG